ncbi:outer membrane efflux protein [Geobacter metallireducens RCH3]|uniref:Efflux pump, RND family, outer membrane protein n=1 Tax=Geobacter metallireducens (strain ATCC 53774 / DSM 7210 / GS-15) TaxID=269799 RepID=Q39Q00_GEOMG|nr:TolC family protein [Geobacter metallireducens]ABB33674.1 efflux pump, RND family, outer membrane protein [Geobacter metallireducens GS-15]EHP85370.1 outer membrane efflux protein [Geobacter metallireducens RCH3]
MKRLVILMGMVLLPHGVFAEAGVPAFALSRVIDFALENEPKLSVLGKDIEAAKHTVDAAKGGRWPRLDLEAGITRYRYAAPITPISGAPQNGGGFPPFDKDIYDASLTLKLPIYRGGRLVKNVEIAEINRLIAERALHQGRQELVFNVTSVYCKILELEELLKAHEQNVRQLEEHRRVTEQFVKAGSAARVDLMKTDVELAHGRQQVLATQNAGAAAYALLRSLMGVDESYPRFTVAEEPFPEKGYPPEEKAVEVALRQRPDYLKVKARTELFQARLDLARGKRLPSVDVAGEYGERAGDSLSFKENWNIGLRLSYPLFDGGITRAEIKKGMVELERTGEELRAVRLSIVREVREAYLAVADAEKRLAVAREAISSAEENLRVEQLKYETGVGTTRDVIDAQTALLRATTDRHQASYDLAAAKAALDKALGSNAYGEVASR